jgi:pyruvate kinase
MTQRVDHQSTKIIATIGPASDSYATLLELARAGVDVFRLNFSHGSHSDHLEVINHIASINEEYNYHVGILADLQGPKIRIGKIENDAINIAEGDVLHFVNEDCIGNKDKIYLSYTQFPSDVKVGEKVLVDDGKIVLKVLSTNQEDQVALEVVHGGVLSSRKGVNLPDTKITLPSLTKKDLVDLEFILKQPVNWIALSFVRSPKAIKRLRRLVEKANNPAKIIAKIEKPEAVNKIDKIIKASNAIMIARGDLGVEMPIEKLPAIQKKIINKCIQRARPVIVATQLMDSMIVNPSPTRAEVTDVANAVLDGTDAVMLSGETSVGKFPVDVVKAMNRIIEEAEKNYSIKYRRPKPSKNSSTFASDVVCFNAARTAEEVKAKAIIGMTSSGYTAFRLSSYRPDMKIYIFSDKTYMLSTLNLLWGVHGFYYDKFTSTDETIHDVTKILKFLSLVKKGDFVVNTGSMPMYKRYRTNMLKVTLIE